MSGANGIGEAGGANGISGAGRANGISGAGGSGRAGHANGAGGANGIGNANGISGSGHAGGISGAGRAGGALGKLKKTAIGLIPILAFFLIWQIAAGRVPKGVLAPPTKVIPATLGAFLDPKEQMLLHTLISLRRIGLGLLLAVVAGVLAGFLLGTRFKNLERLFLPFFKVCEKINPFAVIPVFMIFFGIGDKEKVALVFWACVWPILTTTQEAAKSVDPALVRAARAMGASPARLFRTVIFPYVLPNIFTGVKLAVRVAFFMIVAAETIGSSAGLGWYYTRKQAMYKLPLIYGSILFITAMAIALNYAFSKMERKMLVWKQAVFSESPGAA